MKILATNVYVGPSLYAHFPVIRHQVDIGVLEDWPSSGVLSEAILSNPEYPLQTMVLIELFKCYVRSCPLRSYPIQRIV